MCRRATSMNGTAREAACRWPRPPVRVALEYSREEQSIRCGAGHFGKASGSCVLTCSCRHLSLALRNRTATRGIDSERCACMGLPAGPRRFRRGVHGASAGPRRGGVADVASRNGHPLSATKTRSRERTAYLTHDHARCHIAAHDRTAHANCHAKSRWAMAFSQY